MEFDILKKAEEIIKEDSGTSAKFLTNMEWTRSQLPLEIPAHWQNCSAHCSLPAAVIFTIGRAADRR